MWWGKSEQKADKLAETPRAAKDTTVAQGEKEFDPDKLPDRKQLPASLQRIAREQEKDDNFFDELVEG